MNTNYLLSEHLDVYRIASNLPENHPTYPKTISELTQHLLDYPNIRLVTQILRNSRRNLPLRFFTAFAFGLKFLSYVISTSSQPFQKFRKLAFGQQLLQSDLQPLILSFIKANFNPIKKSIILCFIPFASYFLGNKKKKKKRAFFRLKQFRDMYSGRISSPAFCIFEIGLEDSVSKFSRFSSN